MNILLNMKTFIKKYYYKPSLRVTSCLVLLVFGLSSIMPSVCYGQNPIFLLPAGQIVSTTPAFIPPVLKGMKIDTGQPFKFDFILDSGNAELDQQELKDEADKLIKYFLVSLTIPEDDLWVNLSPYEQDRIIPDEFGVTEMGRDLLVQDYLLKQLASSLIYPETQLGEEFWRRVYKRANQIYGTTEIPVNTFNKVWVVPDKAVVYENDNIVYVLESRLKVMLEEDYQSLAENLRNDKLGTDRLEEQDVEELSSLSSAIFKEIIIPEIEKEVNEGRHFAPLRQVYHSLILAKWYKQNLKQSLINRKYSDQKKVSGVDLSDKTEKDKIYRQYIQVFREGVFDYIKEDFDEGTQEMIPRKYFSGGLGLRTPLQVQTGKLTPQQLAQADTAVKLSWIESHFVRSRVSARSVNEYIKQQFEAGPIDEGTPIDLENGKQARVFLIPGLLQATGQFGHIGLGTWNNDQPVVYLDQEHGDNEQLRANEAYKVSRWEELKVQLGNEIGDGSPLTAREMRQWIKANTDRAAGLLMQWDRQAPSIQDLFVQFQALLPSNEQIAATYQLPGDFEDLNLAAGRTGMEGVTWYEGLEGLNLEQVRKKIFGENIDQWLKYYEEYGRKDIRIETAKTLLGDPGFIEMLKNRAKNDLALEIIRFAVRKNIYLGTQNLKTFLVTLKQEADQSMKGLFPEVGLPIISFVQFISDLGMMQEYLNSESFWGMNAEDRLAMLAAKIKEMDLPLNSDNLPSLHAGLPMRLSVRVSKEDIQIVRLPAAVHDQLQAAIKDERVQGFLNSDAFMDPEQTPPEDRLAVLVDKIREFQLPLDSDNLRNIHSGLPARLSARVAKADIQGVGLTEAAYNQLRNAIKDQRIQEFLDSDEFLNPEQTPAEDRLRALVKKIRALGLPLDSDNLGFIYSGLPARLSAKARKKDIQKVLLTEAVYDELRAAIQDERVQEFLDRDAFADPEQTPAEDRLAILVEQIRELGLPLDSDNLGHIHSGLPARLSARITKEDIQGVGLPAAVYSQLQTAIADQRIQAFLDRDAFMDPEQTPAEDRLGALVDKIREEGLPLDSDNLPRIYTSLPVRLSAKVTKGDVLAVQLSKGVYDQLRAAIKDQRIQAFLDSDVFMDSEQTPVEDRLAVLVQKIQELGLPLGSDNLPRIYSGLPVRLSQRVGKKDFQRVDLSVGVYNQLRAAIKDGRIQAFLDSDAFTDPEQSPAEDRLVVLVKKIRELGLPLDSVNLAQIYSGLPARLSARITKADIQKVNLPEAVYDQLRAAIADPRIQAFLDNEAFMVSGNTSEDRLRALVYKIREVGLPLGSDNLDQIDTGLPARLSAKVTKEDVRYLKASPARQTNHPGGIDFDLDLLNLEIQGWGAEFNVPLNDPALEQIQIEGLMPIIINIQPVVNLPLLLGAEENEEQYLASALSP